MTRFEFAPDARKELRTRIAWWRANRPAAPNRVTMELRRILRFISANPGLGKVYDHPSGRALRSYRIPKTPYFVVYEIGAHKIRIATIGSYEMEAPPPL